MNMTVKSLLPEKFYFLIIVFLTIFNSFGENLKTGDLIFVRDTGGDFSSAISNATASEDSIKIVHVGIIVEENDTVYVYEASPKSGVRKITLNEFKKEESLIIPLIIKRLKTDFSIPFLLENLKRHLGEPYDWWYLPDNGKMYCSELIQTSFRDENLQPIFLNKPMNFRSKDGRIPEFWVNLFRELDMDVPEGVPGSNPNDIFKDKRLIMLNQ